MDLWKIILKVRHLASQHVASDYLPHQQHVSSYRHHRWTHVSMVNQVNEGASWHGTDAWPSLLVLHADLHICIMIAPPALFIEM